MTPLLDQLERFRPAHPAEAASLERIRTLLRSAERPFARDTFEPGHITSSAFVVDRRNRGTVLLHHPKLGIWVQPGGHLEPGDDSPEAGALREAREETGLKALVVARELAQPFDVDVHDIPARGAEPAHAHHDLRFLLLGDFDEKPAAGDGETDRVRWFAWDEAFALDLDPNLRLGLEKARYAMTVWLKKQPASGAGGSDTIWARLTIIPILLASLTLGYFGYQHVYLPRVAASLAGSDVYYAGDRDGLVTECAAGSAADGAAGRMGRYGGLRTEAGAEHPGVAVQRGTPFQVVRNHPSATDWLEVRTRSGDRGFVHALCVFASARDACAGPDGKPENDCMKRAGFDIRY